LAWTGRKRDVSFLTNLPGASEKLRFFNADLSDPESFGPAVEGCVGIFHTATPIDFAVNEPEEVVTQRAIEGALGILKAAVKSKTVKRVVYTSSASTVSFTGPEPQDVVDESAWSDVDLLRNLKPFSWSYTVSKVLTEKAVFEFGAQNGLEVVSLVPPFVVGSFICPKLPDSVERALILLFGTLLHLFSFSSFKLGSIEITWHFFTRLKVYITEVGVKLMQAKRKKLVWFVTIWFMWMIWLEHISSC